MSESSIVILGAKRTPIRITSYNVCYTKLLRAGHEDKLRYQTVLFTGPTDVKGTAYLSSYNFV